MSIITARTLVNKNEREYLMLLLNMLDCVLTNLITYSYFSSTLKIPQRNEKNIRKTMLNEI